MFGHSSKSGSTKILMASVLLNVALVAYVITRMSMYEAAPPAPPPPVVGEEAAVQATPPRSTSVLALLGRTEMNENMQEMRSSLEKARELRKAFAKKLATDVVSKDEALEFFSEMDEVMDAGREKVHEMMAEKISTLTDEDRKRISEQLDRSSPAGQADGKRTRRSNR